MLQQTQVKTVLPYFERFTSRFPDVERLARASEQDVLAAWSGLGYYKRAKALHQAAKWVVEENGGRFPETLDGWLALPGVGRYTAGAILSIAYGQRHAILDGNVARVLSRVFLVRGDPRSGPARKLLWQKAEEVLPTQAILGVQPSPHGTGGVGMHTASSPLSRVPRSGRLQGASARRPGRPTRVDC